MSCVFPGLLAISAGVCAICANQINVHPIVIFGIILLFDLICIELIVKHIDFTVDGRVMLAVICALLIGSIILGMQYSREHLWLTVMYFCVMPIVAFYTAMFIWYVLPRK